MPEDNNKQNTPQEQITPASENTNEQEKSIHVRNPFTGEEVDITQEQLDNVEKGIEAQTERD